MSELAWSFWVTVILSMTLSNWVLMRKRKHVLRAELRKTRVPLLMRIYPSLLT